MDYLDFLMMIFRVNVGEYISNCLQEQGEIEAN